MEAFLFSSKFKTSTAQISKRKSKEKNIPEYYSIYKIQQNTIEEDRNKVEKKELFKLIEEVKKKTGKESLSDEQLLLLTAFEISRTYTYEEKKNSI